MKLYVCCPVCIRGMVKNQLTVRFIMNPCGDFDKGVHDHRVIIIFRSFEQLRKTTISFIVSVRMEQPAPTGQNVMKFDI
jgi:hypothetical protein